MFRSVEFRPARTRLRPRRAAGAALRSVGLSPAFPLAALPLADGDTLADTFGVTADAASAADPTSAAVPWAAAPVAGLRAASEGTRGAGLRWLGGTAWPRRDCGDKAILLTMPGAAFRWPAPVLGASEVYRDSVARCRARLNRATAIVTSLPSRVPLRHRFATFATLTLGHSLINTRFSATEEGSCGWSRPRCRRRRVVDGSGAIERGRRRVEAERRGTAPGSV